MSNEIDKAKTEWKNMNTDKKFTIILAIIILVAMFLPWLSVSFGVYGSASVNGIKGVGYLTFLGSIAYLLWKILPMFGVKIPDLKMKDDVIEKIIAVAMVAGPILWLLELNFKFKHIGIGFYIALIVSVLFAYITFTDCTYSKLKEKISSKMKNVKKEEK